MSISHKQLQEKLTLGAGLEFDSETGKLEIKVKEFTFTEVQEVNGVIVPVLTYSDLISIFNAGITWNNKVQLTIDTLAKAFVDSEGNEHQIFERTLCINAYSDMVASPDGTRNLLHIISFIIQGHRVVYKTIGTGDVEVTVD